MDLKSHKEFIKTQYEKYKKIGHVECPAFGNEKIYFNRHGFRHLIWKGTKIREIEEQIERLNLLKYAQKILSSSVKFKDYNKNKKLNYVGNVDFWSFKQTHDGIQIITLVRQVRGGNKHFFSVMKKEPKKHKTP